MTGLKIDEASPLFPVYELIEGGKVPSAIQTIDNMLETDPQSFDLYNLKGVCFYKLGRYGEAIDFFNKSISIYDKDFYPFEMKGRCQFFLAKFFDAIDSFYGAYERNNRTEKRVDLLLSAGFVALLSNDVRAFDYFPLAYELDERLTVDAIQEIFEKVFLHPVMNLAAEKKIEIQEKINELRESIKEAKSKIAEWGLNKENQIPEPIDDSNLQ